MNYITSGRLKLAGAALAGLFVSVFINTTFFQGSVASVVAMKEKVAVTGDVRLSTTTIPVLVSGVVSAANSTVIYAQTAGVVTSLMAREGSIVSVGELLSRQSTPVLDAELQLASAQSSLVSLQQSVDVNFSRGGAEQAKVRTYSALEIAKLRTLGNDSRLSETSAALLIGTKTSVLSATDAINYVNNNRSLFSSEGLRLYDEAVTVLYGNVPKYFRGALLPNNKSAENLTSLLHEVQSNPNPSALALIDVAVIAQKQLEMLSELFATAEADVFDRKSLFVSDDTREEYLAKRASVLASKQSLQSAQSGLQKVMDGVLEEAVSLNTEVAITDIDRQVAEERLVLVGLIASQSEVVSRASEAVVFAQQTLGSVRAPFAGLIGKVHVDVGEYVLPGTPLMTLVGTGARELEVSVPAYWIENISVGQSFEVEGNTIGFVERFSSISEGGSGTVVITLLPEFSPRVGSSLFGNLLLNSVESIYTVPRAYVHFDSDGPYVEYEAGERSRVKIIYDNSNQLYLEVMKVINSPLVPATSISL